MQMASELIDRELVSTMINDASVGSTVGVLKVGRKTALLKFAGDMLQTCPEMQTT